jgi:hypothetical protein
MAARNSVKDKEMAKYLKDHGIERRSGICPICYSPIPNDTFGGFGAAAHLSRCTKPSKKYSKFAK